MNKIPVIEIFGPTIQGEGMAMGKKTMFVRTAGCDYSCAWCDSKFTWDGSVKEEIVQMTALEIWKKLKAHGGDRFSHVTLSGGNPGLYKQIADLVKILQENDIEIALETQGSRWQDWFLHIDDLTISPKPPSSKMRVDFDILDEIIDKLLNNKRLRHTSLKIVIFNDKDLQFAKQVTQRYPLIPLYLQVGNEDLDQSDNDQLTRQLLNAYEWLIRQTMAEKALNHARVLPQMHALVWGNRRGV
ncbi:MAG TPA: 7-carboxy-7-deazaguanine synthase QueE [Bacillota bacterium]|nr:7-carboxy-7-deazaguanine synthase QueE [Bacillota bacterium]